MCVCVCFFLLMCTVQIQLCPPLLNKSFFKYELCCLQQFSASRHHPLSAYTASVHLTLPLLLSALRTADQMHHPPTFYSGICMLSRAHIYTHMHIHLGTSEKGKRKSVCVCVRERVCGDWCYILLVSAGSWPAD